ncbi:MAG: hypothetical protein GXO70_05755 [Acidobacteria bacterium]|nr:hypothetical protein [Acidobacteriota bacterium]
MNWKNIPYRVISFLSLLSMGLFPALSQAQFIFSLKGIAIHGAIITDFLQNHNTDDNFGHYATDSGSNFASTVNESWFSVSGGLGEINGIDTSFEASFDFMGDNDFEIVSAWIRLEKGEWYFLAGKAENLVATGETTLNYDGFYSAGGIQTGAHANQNQLQLGIRLTEHVTLAASLTDEPAQNGSLDDQTFSSTDPAMEGALFFEFPGGSGKIAGHRGFMRLSSGEAFHPSVIMAEVTLPVTESLSLVTSAFRSTAGSQFFTTDILFDCAPLPTGHVGEFSAVGGFVEMLFKAGNFESWAGIGTFSLTKHSKTHLLNHQPEDALTDNHRFSAGTRYSFSSHLNGGVEFTHYRTTHLRGTETRAFTATSVQLQLSLTF